jgi:uncharacterized protein (DUF885 family)
VGLAVVLALGVEGCAASTHRLPSPTDSVMARVRLDRVVMDHWRFIQTSRPDLAARADISGTPLPDPTQNQAKKDAQFARAGLVALDEIYVDALRQHDYVTWLSLRWEFEAMAGWTAFHWTRLDDLVPGHSVFDRSIEVLKAQRIQGPNTGESFTKLVASVADLARAVQEEYAERARRGVLLPREASIRAVAHLRELITPVESGPFRLDPVVYRVPPDTAWQAPLARAVQNTIEQKVNPALISLASFLEQLGYDSSSSPGLARLPGGAAHYATLLRYRTTLEVTPADAHAIGLREVARVAALAVTARQAAGLPVSRDSLRAALRSDPRFAIDERRSLSEAAAETFEAATKSLDSLFQPAPTMTLTIGAMPFDLEEFSLSRYELPTAARLSARYLLSVSQLERRSAFALPSLIIGDLMPGLHRQQGVQFENNALPGFRRLAFHDGFVRGWQVYAIDVADSLTTTLAPWQRFSLRMRELQAACGLVVDTGINALGWTRSDALRFLRAYLPDDDEDLEREFIVEAIESPGTLSAAALGARELRGLRRWAMRELGDRFNLAGFHRELLTLGSVPLPVLGAHLERWIWEQKNPALPDSGVRR